MGSTTSLLLASKQISVYFGLSIFVGGIIGGSLNIIIFTTLKTFRETTCAFFLTVISIVNVIQLVTTPFIFILGEGFQIDLRAISWFCKLHMFLSQWSIFLSLYSLCLATIDQFLSMTKYRQWSNLRIAQRSILTIAILGFIHCLPIFIYFDAAFGKCMIVNTNYAKYMSLFQFPVLYGCLPIVIMMTFSIFTYNRVRSIASRRLNIIRLRRDRQLTAMVLVHVLIRIVITLPYTIFYIYSSNQSFVTPERIALINLISTITVMLSFSNFSISFYIYCCVSKRFRKQLIHVLIDTWMQRWRQWLNRLTNNIVRPNMNIVFVKSSTVDRSVHPEHIAIRTMS